MIKKLYQDDRGMVAVITAFFLLVLVALAGLVIDGGLLIYQRIRLEAATEAAAMATVEAYDVAIWEEHGIVELDPYWAEIHARNYLNINLPEAILESCEVNPFKKNQAIVRSKMEVNTVFMRAFGIEKRTIRTLVRSIGG